MGTPEAGEYDYGPEYYGEINILYSPEANDIIEAIEYPNQQWFQDEIGKYRLFIFKINPVVTHVKYYFIGML